MLAVGAFVALGQLAGLPGVVEEFSDKSGAGSAWCGSAAEAGWMAWVGLARCGEGAGSVL